MKKLVVVGLVGLTMVLSLAPHVYQSHISTTSLFIEYIAGDGNTDGGGG
ncbi:MAG: hypothetical protein AAF267_06425 [Deinococcota bacterium]